MACSNCSNGRGNTPTLPSGCKNNGNCGTSGCNKLNVFDWLSNMQPANGEATFDWAEIRFKNTRKEFFKNTENLQLCVGDAVATEASPGHDIGIVSLTGELVRVQMRKAEFTPNETNTKKIFRKAKPNDVDKWKLAMDLEKQAMITARNHATDLRLDMKISDSEYQGDGTKVTFYYIAESRVDFRELIKLLARDLKVRIEMRQIGARQEAGRVGGIGSCGRELCCATWLKDFRTVTTTAARYQQLSINPQKLAGQCGKLKCCLNYELESYLDALKDFPTSDTKLRTKAGNALHIKTDIFKRIMYYGYEGEMHVFHKVSVDRVNEIIALNKNNEMPEALADENYVEKVPEKPVLDYGKVGGEDSINRFDAEKRKKKKKKKNKNREGAPQNAGPNTNPNAPKPNPNQNPNQNRPNNSGPKPNSQNNNNKNEPRPPKPASPNENNPLKN